MTIRSTSSARPASGIYCAAVIALVAVVAPTGVSADEATDQLEIVDTGIETDSPLTIGETVEFRAEIEHPAGLDITIGTPDATSRWVEVDRRITTDDDAATATTVAELDYALFRPGPTSGPPVTVGADGMPPVEFPATDLVVEEVTDADEDFASPRPLRPLFGLSDDQIHVVTGATGALLLGLLTATFWWRRRKPTPSPPPRSPEERVRAELTRLAETDLDDPTLRLQWYVRLSAAIRRYLGERWNFPGTELTTAEIADRLHHIDDPDLRADPDALVDWLRGCDRIKFAGIEPTADEASSHLERAFEIVDNTRRTTPDNDDRSPTTSD